MKKEFLQLIAELNLEEYCNENNISYQYIKYKLYQYKKTPEKLLPLNLQIQLAIHTHKKRRKYTDIPYKGLRLVDYCKTFDIEFRKIACRCRYFIQKGNDFSLLTENQIEKFINHNYYKQEIRNLKNIFIELDCCSKEKYLPICVSLNINYKQMVILSKKNNIDMKTLIYLTWYSSDRHNDNEISISQNKLNHLLKGNSLEMNDLYGFYKAGHLEYLDRILEYEKGYLIGFVFRVIKKYNFKVSKFDYDDLFLEAQLILVKCIQRNVLNQIGCMIRYIEKSVTNQILNYIIKNYSNRNVMFDDTRNNTIELTTKWEY